MNRPQAKTEINKSYILNAIRKYNKLMSRPMARQQTYLDAVLSAVGIHAGLLPRSRAIAPSLKPEERYRVVFFLNCFLQAEGIRGVEVKLPTQQPE